MSVQQFKEDLEVFLVDSEKSGQASKVKTLQLADFALNLSEADELVQLLRSSLTSCSPSKTLPVLYIVDAIYRRAARRKSRRTSGNIEAGIKKILPQLRDIAKSSQLNMKQAALLQNLLQVWDKKGLFNSGYAQYSLKKRKREIALGAPQEESTQSPIKKPKSINSPPSSEPPGSRPFPLEDLPGELILVIMGQLDILSIWRMSQCCRQLLHFVGDAQLWKQIDKVHFTSNTNSPTKFLFRKSVLWLFNRTQTPSFVVTIDLSWSNAVTDHSVSTIISQSQKLRSLLLNGAEDVTDLAFLRVKNAPGLASLVTLGLSCTQVSPVGLKKCLQLTPLLEDLDVSYTKVSVRDDDVESLTVLLARCPNIRALRYRCGHHLLQLMLHFESATLEFLDINCYCNHGKVGSWILPIIMDQYPRLTALSAVGYNFHAMAHVQKRVVAPYHFYIDRIDTILPPLEVVTKDLYLSVTCKDKLDTVMTFLDPKTVLSSTTWPMSVRGINGWPLLHDALAIGDVSVIRTLLAYQYLFSDLHSVDNRGLPPLLKAKDWATLRDIANDPNYCKRLHPLEESLIKMESLCQKPPSQLTMADAEEMLTFLRDVETSTSIQNLIAQQFALFSKHKGVMVKFLTDPNPKRRQLIQQTLNDSLFSCLFVPWWGESYERWLMIELGRRFCQL